MLWNAIVQKEPIHKGWSCDKKFCAQTADGTKYLLRLTPHEKSGTRRQLFDLLGRVAETGILMCRPVEFGDWEGGAYTFYTWIDGADANEVIPAANADADQIIKSAEGYKESKINEANGQAARFKSLFDEYEKYPLITKQRLYYEAMEEILPGIKLYIVDENTGVQTALPLSPFASVDMGGEN